jgi:hypothetical protein
LQRRVNSAAEELAGDMAMRGHATALKHRRYPQVLEKLASMLPPALNPPQPAHNRRTPVPSPGRR